MKDARPLEEFPIIEAWSHAESGDISTAVNLLGACSEIIGGPPCLHRAMAAAIFVKAGQSERALDTLSGDWTRTDADAAGLAGALLFSMAQFDHALPALRHAVAGNPVDPGAHMVNLGRTLVHLGQAEDALPFLRQGLACSTHDHVLAAQSLAEAYLFLGEFDAADQALAGLPATSADEQILATRVALRAMAGRHEEAFQFLAAALADHPDCLPLLLIHADLAEALGRTSLSIDALQTALKQDPENIELWVRLARSGPLQSSTPLARNAADKALELSQGQGPFAEALALVAHAHVLTSDGQVDAGQAAYQKALQLVPGMVTALSGLGHLLLQKGQVEAAISCFEQVKAAAPLQGWSQLIQAREVPDDNETLENMERVARQPSLEGPIRSGLLLTVAAAWDRKKNYDRAMELAREANAAARALMSYDPTQQRAFIDRQIARFSKPFMESRTGWGDPSRLPVFVLGMPRSGTTLTEQILGSHSQICGAGELNLISDLIGKLEAWQLKLGSGLCYPECVADLTAEMSRVHAGLLLEKLRTFDSDAKHVVDKLPHNFQHIGLIKLLFPNAVIFHCRRDARDIAVSNFMTDYAAKFSGMGFAYDLGWIGAQLVDHDRLMAHWHDVFPGQIFEVVYEDLVEDVEGWARQMIKFLGLHWEPEVLNFQKLDRQVKTASTWQVRQPVYTSSKARWKRYRSHLEPLEAALQDVPPHPDTAPLPSVPAGLFGQAMAQLKAGAPAAAEQHFAQVISAYPNHAAAHHFFGVALLQQGQIEEALKAMRRSIALLPSHPSWHENLARAEQAAGDFEAANELLERARHIRQAQADVANAAGVA
jgi:tetratricopeptide (TPR) repeat protein